MANRFDAQRDCSDQVQQEAGLTPAQVPPRLLGNRDFRTPTGDNAINCEVNDCALPRESNQEIWELIPQPLKDAPANQREAMGYYMIARGAGIPDGNIPLGIMNMVPVEGQAGYEEMIGRIVTAGCGLVEGTLDPKKFVSFLHTNMDEGYRKRWNQMTGRQQYEWFSAWRNSGRTHVRNEGNTLGLVGTDPRRITTRPQLIECLRRSPSLRRRRNRNHQFTVQQWNEDAATARL